MKVPRRTREDAEKAAIRTLLDAGEYDALIREAVEKRSKSNKPMIELVVEVWDAEGSSRILRDWLTAADLGAAKLLHCAEAVGALAKWEAGDISAADFRGRNVVVTIIVETRRGYGDTNRIDNYAPPQAAGVVNLHRQAG